MILVRRGEAQDLAEVASIQAASPDASQWNPAEYLQYDFRVAVSGIRVAGFAVSRALAEGECEVLNLAVAPEFRRQGVGRKLLKSLLDGYRAAFYLEVRESNLSARNFYKVMGFEEVAARPGYYLSSPEAAIVMKFHSC